ncbi:MAG: hypothetical protein ACK5KP_04465 [Paludibacteraceae bacterium]
MAILFEKIKGEIVRKDNLQRQFDSYLQTLKNGEYLLSAKRVTQKRSVNQNNMMWMWFACLSLEVGQDKDDFYDYYREKYLSRTIELNGKTVKVTTGTSKLDTVGMTHFLNQVQADASIEFGVKLPTPEDLYWEEFQNYYKRFL